MWRRCAVVLLLALWQACHAEDLVNLASPVRSWLVYKQYGREFTRTWVKFNGAEPTSVTIPGHGGSDDYALVGYNNPSEPISPTRYRITLPGDMAMSRAPSSWKVTGKSFTSRRTRSLIMDVVNDAVFKDGVYEGALLHLPDSADFFFEFYDRENATIAGIELLGPRELLDALWPDGLYPCSRRLDWLGALTGPKKIFSRPKQNGRLRDIFHLFPLGSVKYKYDGSKPVIVGAELQEPTMLREVVVEITKSGITRLELQASFCQPHCRKYGSKGWIKLAQVHRKKGYKPSRWHKLSIKNPDKYKGYRVKIYPRWTPALLQPAGIHFSQCPEEGVATA